jgi:hypothetical protein
MYKILSAILFSLVTSNTTQRYFNPTGTYDLVSNAKVVKGDTYGVTGDIQVKALSRNKIVVVLGVNMGAPVYNSGELFDTLQYVNNTCVYNGGQYDPSCRITLKFNEDGIKVTQKQADLNFGCGFGHGVFADGFYKKQSNKIPVLRHPQTGELIK